MDDEDEVRIDQKLLRITSGNFDVETITSLDLSNMGIRKIENLDSMKKLEVLNLSGNRISVIENLNKLTNLKVLNLGSNQISSLKGLRNMYKLRVMVLKDNQISNIEEIKYLKNSTNLRIVNLKGNEIMKKNEELYNVLKELFPKIIKYNDMEIKDFEFATKHKNLDLPCLDLSKNDFQYEEKEFYYILENVKKKVSSLL